MLCFASKPVSLQNQSSISAKMNVFSDHPKNALFAYFFLTFLCLIFLLNRKNRTEETEKKESHIDVNGTT